MLGVAGKTTLVRKILWGVLPVVLLSLGGVGLSNYSVAKSQILTSITQYEDSLAQELSENLGAFFDQCHRDIQSLVEVPDLQDYSHYVEYNLTDEASDTRTKVQNYFLDFAKRAPVCTSILYFDQQHKFVAGIDHGSPLNSRDYAPLGIQEQPGSTVWLSSIKPGTKDKWIIRYASPVFNKETGKPCGVMVLTCNLEGVCNDLAQPKLGKNGLAYIADRNGHPILNGPTGTVPANGHAVPIPHTPWSVVVAADQDQFLAPLVMLRNLSIWLLGLVGVLALLFLTMVVRRATHPIVDLVAGTRKLAAGDLDYRFPIPDIRELSVLAVSFNDMGEKLKLRETDLRSRIRQLTALRDMESSVIERLDEEAILRSCLDAAAAGLGFDRIGLYWVDEEDQSIVGRFLHEAQPSNDSEENFRRRRVPLGNSDILNQVLRTHQPALVKHAHVIDSTEHDHVPQSPAGGFVMAPICGKDRVFGVITADNLHTGRPLDESDRDGLMLFAGAAGLALENTGLFDRLSVSEARHRLVLDNSPVAILGLAEDYTINTWNRGAEVMFGYTTDEVMGKPIESLFPATPLDYGRLVTEVATHGGVREFAIVGAAKGGRALDLTLSWDGSRPEGAANKEWAVVIRDVTEAKKMQRQLIFSEKLSAVGQLISGIAHELNNPLQAVVGYAEILNAPRPAGSALPVREMKHIFDNATRCRKIIDNLLLFVRQGEVRKNTIKVQDVIRASLELLQHKIKKTAGVQVTTDLPDAPLYTKANFQQIEQVIVNIVNNACDAMEGWEGPRQMRITAKEVGTSIHVTLADTGPGIPAEVCARIFEPFFTTKPEGRGTGLGLPVCRQIVAEHGGELRVDTKVGAGTTFSFELPLVQPEPVAEAAQTPETTESESQSSAAAEAPAAGSGGALLVVEDEMAIRELLEEVLVAAGHRVETAASLEAASAKVTTGTYDAIVSDVQLDDGTGVDLYKAWPTLTPHPRPPFLFLSGDILAGAIGGISEDEDVYMLQKPINLQELRTAISTILAKQHPVTASR